jgi:hypothetical protein
MRKGFLIICLIFSSFSSIGQVLTIGPMLHCYFPKGKPKITFGIEAALHLFLFPKAIPSIDIGLEGGKGMTYLYSELQLTRPRKVILMKAFP